MISVTDSSAALRLASQVSTVLPRTSTFLYGLLVGCRPAGVSLLLRTPSIQAHYVPFSSQSAFVEFPCVIRRSSAASGRPVPNRREARGEEGRLLGLTRRTSTSWRTSGGASHRA